MVTALKRYLRSAAYTYRIFRNEKIVVDNFLIWAERHTPESMEVLVRLRTYKHQWKMQNGELISVSGNRTKVRFILTTPKELVTPINNIAPVLLFTSDLWCIYEYSDDTKSVLRHGLENKERQAALTLARNHLTQVLEEKEINHDSESVQLLSPYSEPTTVDVMLWVNGELRGSKIYTGSSLIEALCVGVVLSARDDRFKPLAQGELPEVRIEVNIISDLHIPVINREEGVFKNPLQSHNGYLVKYKTIQGWYLPVIFNVKNFASLSDLLHSLALEKAGIPKNYLTQVQFFVFSVEIFRESVLLEKVVGMHGAVCMPETSTHTVKEILSSTETMARWLCSVATVDGYLPLKADPYTKKVHVTDWRRMAFAAFALGVYGRTMNNEECIAQAKITANYLRSIYGKLNQSASSQAIVGVYLGRLALALGNLEEAKTGVMGLQSLIVQGVAIPTIGELQIASFFSDLNEAKIPDHEVFTLQSRKIVDIIFNGWEQALMTGREISFAEYAELVPLLYTLLQASKGADREQAKIRYEGVCKWYETNQLVNGAFPTTTRSNYCYTRGTGKIWEALAVDPANEEVCFKAAQYILSLQYHPEAMFNIPPRLTQQFGGAIMHDEANHEAWTDSVGHVLIAVARMAKRNTKNLISS